MLFFGSKIHKYPIACLATKSNDAMYMSTKVNVVMYMTIIDSVPDNIDGLGLIMKAEELSKNKQFTDYNFGGLRFPMVNINQGVDIGWLKGMATVGKDNLPYYISQALQQNKLRINEIGARAQSATAISVRLMSAVPPPPDYTIDRPFLVWFERRGLSKPIFAAYVTEEDWRNPGDISVV